MRVEMQALPARAGDLEAGSFFRVLRGKERFFCVAISDFKDGKGTLVFTRRPNMAAPWVMGGRFVNDTVASYPDAILKLDDLGGQEIGGRNPIGSIISTANGSYILASMDIGSYRYFDIATGLLALDVPASGEPAIVYEKWQIGHIERDGFLPLFRFPEDLPPEV